MAIGNAVSGEFVNASETFLTEIGKVGHWLEALGIVVVLWLFFEIVAFLINRRRMKEVYKIKEDMQRIERKIDNVLEKMN